MHEKIRDKDVVRKAFRCAFNALPASSPSTPNSSVSKGELFLRFNCSSPVFLMASRGVSLLNFTAGSHAEIHKGREEGTIIQLLQPQVPRKQ